MKPTRTWILIANGHGARLLEALGEGRGYQERSVSTGRRPSSGTVVDGATPYKLPEERPSAAKALETLFASQLGAMLAGYLRNDAFDKLIIVSPPPMLAKLRKMIPAEVREKVVAEVEEDLTTIPTVEISRYLDDVVSL